MSLRYRRAILPSLLTLATLAGTTQDRFISIGVALPEVAKASKVVNIARRYLHDVFAHKLRQCKRSITAWKKFDSVFTCFSNSAVSEDVFHLVQRVNKWTDVPSRIEADRTD